MVNKPQLKRSCCSVLSVMVLVAIGWLASSARADVTIIGSLSNFDVHNNSGSTCTEFDIEFEGPHPEDVIHTYHNGNYGSPTITSLPGNIGIRVVYRNPNHATAVGAIEHFGVSLNSAHPSSHITAQRFQWIPGQINPPYPPPPPPPPPPPLAMPRVTCGVVVLPTGPVSRTTIENIDPLHRTVWVIRRETHVGREVTLEELMPADPLIQAAAAVDTDAEMIAWGVPLVMDEPLPSAGDVNSEVISFEVFDNARVMMGGEPTDVPGAMFGTVLTAQVLGGQGCPDNLMPQLTAQPVNVSAVLDGSADFTCAATDPLNDQLVYQWRFENQDLEGEDQPHLNIDPVTNATAGLYTCVIANACGRVTTNAVRLSVIQPCRVLDQPQPATGVAGTTVSFSATTAMASDVVRWKRYGSVIPLPMPRYSMTRSNLDKTVTLRITGVTAADAGAYSVEFDRDECTGIISESAELTVSTPVACGRADVAGLGGASGGDGQLTVDDIVYFLSQFFASNVAVADIAALGGGATPDGAITVDDLVVFLSSFFSGCN